LQSLLVEDRAFAAFAIGHLEPQLLPYARFWTAASPEGRSGLVMHAAGALGRTTVLVGDPAAVAAALSLHPGPRAGYLATCAPEHLAVAERVYALDKPLTMMRMTVEARSFHPAPAEPTEPPAQAPERRQHGLRRMVRADARALNALYATGGGPTGYRGEHIEQGVYFGAFEGGRLQAVAGTHLVAPHQGIAVVGNVFTRAEARGRRLAQAVTSAVTEALIESGCALVTLTVDPANTPAVSAYARLGYDRGAPIVEARLRRRDALGLGPALRRMFGRRSDSGEALVRGWPPVAED
ncbi:MAG: GNAT family N-acetyltransferase, partial [Chloroflexi bacterium]|nr:GNAT family N-acetyltransferase [Chloroflexota bacterium]